MTNMLISTLKHLKHIHIHINIHYIYISAVLQNGVKITKEPPAGVRANLKNTFIKLSNETVRQTDKPNEYMKLLFGLAFFHAVAVERKKYVK